MDYFSKVGPMRELLRCGQRHGEDSDQGCERTALRLIRHADEEVIAFCEFVFAKQVVELVVDDVEAIRNNLASLLRRWTRLECSEIPRRKL